MIADTPGPKMTSICWQGRAKHTYSKNFLEFVENYLLVQVITDPTSEYALLDLLLTNTDEADKDKIMEFKVLREGERLFVYHTTA